MFVLLLITALALLILALCMQDIARERAAPILVKSDPSLTTGPLISVLIPARNEAQRIGACLDGLVRQQYRSFEVIVVDDHSSDGTARVARSYAAGLPSLQVVAGAPLPQGWAGKCWACWQSSKQARGEWLLFLDADVEPRPGLLGALVVDAARQKAHMVTLMPLLRLGSLAERLLLPAFQTILYGLYPLHAVSNPHSPIAFANGQALFLRHDIYERTGGHESVRDSVLEDTDLGQHVQRMGFRLYAAAARDLLAVRMYEDWPSTVEGLGKNAIAGYRSGGWRSSWVGFRQALIAFGPLYLVGAGLALWFYGFTAVSPLVPLVGGVLLLALTSASSGWLFRRRYRVSPLWGLLYPLGLALYYGLALRAFVRVRTGRGVIWKGRVLAGK